MKAVIRAVVMGFVVQFVFTIMLFGDWLDTRDLLFAIQAPAFAVARAMLPPLRGDSFPFTFFCLSFAIQSAIYALVAYPLILCAQQAERVRAREARREPR